MFGNLLGNGASRIVATFCTCTVFHVFYKLLSSVRGMNHPIDAAIYQTTHKQYMIHLHRNCMFHIGQMKVSQQHLQFHQFRKWLFTLVTVLHRCDEPNSMQSFSASIPAAVTLPITLQRLQKQFYLQFPALCSILLSVSTPMRFLHHFIPCSINQCFFSTRAGFHK